MNPNYLGGVGRGSNFATTIVIDTLPKILNHIDSIITYQYREHTITITIGSQVPPNDINVEPHVHANLNIKGITKTKGWFIGMLKEWYESLGGTLPDSTYIDKVRNIHAYLNYIKNVKNGGKLQSDDLIIKDAIDYLNSTKSKINMQTILKIVVEKHGLGKGERLKPFIKTRLSILKDIEFDDIFRHEDESYEPEQEEFNTCMKYIETQHMQIDKSVVTVEDSTWLFRLTTRDRKSILKIIHGVSMFMPRLRQDNIPAILLRGPRDCGKSGLFEHHPLKEIASDSKGVGVFEQSANKLGFRATDWRLAKLTSGGLETIIKQVALGAITEIKVNGSTQELLPNWLIIECNDLGELNDILNSGDSSYDDDSRASHVASWRKRFVDIQMTPIPMRDKIVSPIENRLYKGVLACVTYNLIVENRHLLKSLNISCLQKYIETFINCVPSYIDKHYDIVKQHWSLVSKEDSEDVTGTQHFTQLVEVESESACEDSNDGYMM